MSKLNYDSLQEGDEVPAFTTPPITRTTLALFAGASGDHNPIHIDIDFAKKSGADDVFAQGMLGMAYLGRLLTGLVPQTAIRKYSVRFSSITNLQDEVTCTGKVVGKYEEHGEKFIKLDLTATNQIGDVKLSGKAVISL
jgi:acyl dehydratase